MEKKNHENDNEQHDNDDHHRVKTFNIILSFLQETLNIKKLAERYENIILTTNEEKSVLHNNESYDDNGYNNNNNNDDIKSKVYNLLCNDSSSLILNDIMSFSHDENINNNVHVLSNITDTAEIDIFDSTIPKLISDFQTAEQQSYVVLEMNNNNNKVSTSKFLLCNDATTQEDYCDVHSVSLSSSTKRLHELKAFDLSTHHNNKRHKSFHNNDEQQQKQKNITMKSRRLYELHHASKCTNNACCHESKHCTEMKKLWYHMESCRDGLYCQYKHCQSSRNVLNHYEKCVHKNCPVCSSFRHQIAAAKMKQQRKIQHCIYLDNNSTRSLSSNNTSSSLTESNAASRHHHNPCYKSNHYIL